MRSFRKNYILVIIVFFHTFIYTQEPITTFIYKSNWWYDEINGGDIVVRVEVFKMDEYIIDFNLFCKWENISGVINSHIIAEKADDFYNFTFTDDYGNKAFGQISINGSNAYLFFDCSEVSDIGKNYIRLYGEKYQLIKIIN